MKPSKVGDFIIGLLCVVPYNYVLWLALEWGYRTAFKPRPFSTSVPGALIVAWFIIANLAWVIVALDRKRPFVVIGAVAAVALPVLAVGACLVVLGPPRF